MLQFYLFMAAIVQWQNAGLWHRMSWVRPPLAAPKQRRRTATSFPDPILCCDCCFNMMRSVDDAQILHPTSDSLAQRERVTPWLTEFRPRRGVRNGDLQTLLANFLPRRVDLPAPEDTIVEVDPTTQSRVLCHCNWQPEPVRDQRMTLLLLHGLEGSSQSQYMLGNAEKAWRAGWNVIRMNMRNCGGTEMLSPTLYHSGLSGDVRAVAEFFAERFDLSQMAWAGYSMGGNMVLKAAGEYGDSAPVWLRAAVGVSPVLDLQPSADALHDARNRVYEWNFLHNMLARYRRKAELLPGRFSLANCNRVHSIRTYDEYIVAPNCGFLGADDYYYRAASARVLDRIAVPTLILHALDDPFIRILPETLKKSPPIPTSHSSRRSMAATAVFSRPQPMYDDGYWAEIHVAGFYSRRRRVRSGANARCTPTGRSHVPPMIREIVIPWSGKNPSLRYIDLRQSPETMQEIPEAAEYPCVAAALRRWNQQDTSLLTAKCDVWSYPAKLFDAEDLPGFAFARGSYIDLLSADAATFASFEACERQLRSWTEISRSIDLPACRSEWTLRPATNISCSQKT